MKDKIEQFKIQLQQKIKEYNEVSFQRKDLQQQLEELRRQLLAIESRNAETNAGTADRITQLLKESEEC